MNLMENEGLLEAQAQQQQQSPATPAIPASFTNNQQLVIHHHHEIRDGKRSVLRSPISSIVKNNGERGPSSPSPQGEGQGGFTCSTCGNPQYPNGEFATIQLDDIFTHINHFPRPSASTLCSTCAPKGHQGQRDHQVLLHPPQPQYPLDVQHHHQPHLNSPYHHPHIINNNNNKEGIQQRANNVKVKEEGVLNGATTMMHHYYNNGRGGIISHHSPATPASVLSPGDLSDAAGGLSCGSNVSNLSAASTFSSSVQYQQGQPQEPSFPINSGGFSRISLFGNHTPLLHDNNKNEDDDKGRTPPPPLSLTQDSQSFLRVILRGEEETKGPTPKVEQSFLNNGEGPIIASHPPHPQQEEDIKLFGEEEAKKGEEEPPRVPCTLCKKTFKNQKMATIHLKRVHEKAHRYVCDICGVSFSYRGSLDSHLASHNPPEITHDCPTCGQKFKEKSNLHKHIRYHTDNPKKFLCVHCPSGFSKRVNLRYHIKRKHPEVNMNNNNNTSEGVNPLGGGGYNFPHPSTNIIEKGDAGGTPTPQTPTTSGGGGARAPSTKNGSKEKPPGNFKCEFDDKCQRTFLFKNNLKAHMRTHTRDKKYVCDICQKSFIYKESLKNHMLLHSNELPYSCDICLKKFRDRSNRRKHVKNVHKYMFVNGDINNPIKPAPNSNPAGGPAGESGSGAPSPSTGPSPPLQPHPPPKKPNKRGSKKGGEELNTPDNKPPRSIIKSPRVAKKPRNSAANHEASGAGPSSHLQSTGKSVIVSASSTATLLHPPPLASLGGGVEGTSLLDRKIIMSPSGNKSRTAGSPLLAEYGGAPPHLPVTVHVPAAGPGHNVQFVGGAHPLLSGRQVIVKANSTGQEMSPELYEHGGRAPPMQNVIVYPKPKGMGSDEQQQHLLHQSHHHHGHQGPPPPHGYHGTPPPTVISHNIQQQQYYMKQEHQEGSYLGSLSSSSPSPLEGVHQGQGHHHHQHHIHHHQTSQSRSGFEFISSASPLSGGAAAGGEGDLKLFGAPQASGGGSGGYSALYPAGGDPYAGAGGHGQYWTSGPSGGSSEGGQGPPPAAPSSPYETSSHPITSASNVLNAPTYGQPHAAEPILDPSANGNNFLYNFDISYLQDHTLI